MEVADGTEANRWRSLNTTRRNRFAAVGTSRKRWPRRPRFFASTSFGLKPASTRYRLHRTVTRCKLTSSKRLQAVSTAAMPRLEMRDLVWPIGANVLGDSITALSSTAIFPTVRIADPPYPLFKSVFWRSCSWR